MTLWLKNKSIVSLVTQFSWSGSCFFCLFFSSFYRKGWRQMSIFARFTVLTFVLRSKSFWITTLLGAMATSENWWCRSTLDYEQCAHVVIYLHTGCHEWCDDISSERIVLISLSTQNVWYPEAWQSQSFLLISHPPLPLQFIFLQHQPSSFSFIHLIYTHSIISCWVTDRARLHPGFTPPLSAFLLHFLVRRSLSCKRGINAVQCFMEALQKR